MPFWIKFYVVLFVIVLVTNIYAHFKFKVKKLITIYDILSGIFMLYLIYIFWYSNYWYNFSILTFIAFILVLIVDCYFSIYGTLSEMGENIPVMGEKEHETAKVISIIFTAPAYVIGIMMCIKFVTLFWVR